MRCTPIAAALALSLLACGHHGSSDDSGDDGPIDGPPGAIDAPRPDGLAATCTPVNGTPTLTTVTVASNLAMPVFATAPVDDPRLFILEKGTGKIKILKNGAVLATPFVTIGVADGVTDLEDERGLLGLAFAPDYATSGTFYVYFVNNEGTGSGNEEIDRYTVSANPDVANPTGQLVWTNTDPYDNHNGGTIAFGPDGYLYFGVGDGGSAGDPQNRAQNTTVLFGKMNRIDVTGQTTYVSPATNPFVGITGADEIWDWGLRNPYRWSFDRQTGDLYIGDVGQYLYEEIDVEPAATGNRNYGWRQVEGTNHCFNPSSGCDTSGTLPVFEYGHGGGCAMIGGYVYRGGCMPGYQGTYFFGDHCDHSIFTTVWNGSTGTSTPAEQNGLAGSDLAAFGQDGFGELYIVREDSATMGGVVQKIVPQ